MAQATDIKIELSEFLNKNLFFYSREWLRYLKINKDYLIPLLKENGELQLLEESGNPMMKIVAQNILEIKSEEIMALAEERGIISVKTDYPIHMAWELFQSSRGFIWNAIKSFYMESYRTLNADEFFALERHINDVIDLFIESYTACYVSYKDELLKSHRETVDEMSVPIIPIAERVCILPIVGNLDSYRARSIREKTLVRINNLKAKHLIIDISGVPFVDTAVVNHIFKIVKGIKLLGCSTILTGISPKIADTMIELGVEIDRELKTRSNLQQALQDIDIFGDKPALR